VAYLGPMPTASCHDHFREIASRYRAVRSLDVRAVRRIAKPLARLAHAQGERGLRLLDVGTGTGRYLLAVCEALRELGVPIARAVGTDQSSAMLKRFIGVAVTARAEALPYGPAFDTVLSFNALHHLELDHFVAEAARVLRPEGLLILYTRTPEQNRETIWGKHFPDFAVREGRLHTAAALRGALDRSRLFRSVRLRIAAWWQLTSVPTLLRQARARHYSTFRLYAPREFERALEQFRARLRQAYRFPWAIPVRNDHVIVLATRRR